MLILASLPTKNKLISLFLQSFQGISILSLQVQFTIKYLSFQGQGKTIS